MSTRGRFANVNPKRLAADEEGFRATGADTDATDTPEFAKRGARYDHPAGPRNFYASLQEHAAPIELARRAGVQLDRYRLTRVRINARLLDANSNEGLFALGLRRRDLVEKDNRICLELADFARADGCAGICIPSAVVKDATNVVVWREWIPATITVISWMIVAPDDPSPEQSTGDAG